MISTFQSSAEQEPIRTNRESHREFEESIGALKAKLDAMKAIIREQAKKNQNRTVGTK